MAFCNVGRLTHVALAAGGPGSCQITGGWFHSRGWPAADAYKVAWRVLIPGESGILDPAAGEPARFMGDLDLKGL